MPVDSGLARRGQTRFRCFTASRMGETDNQLASLEKFPTASLLHALRSFRCFTRFDRSRQVTLVSQVRLVGGMLLAAVAGGRPKNRWS
jgi:hypothetical protein